MIHGHTLSTICWCVWWETGVTARITKSHCHVKATHSIRRRNNCTICVTVYRCIYIVSCLSQVRKMERLTDIYKQSLEHYRNETKLEYRDLRDRLNKESSVLKTLNADLYHNVTEHVRHLNEHLNASTNRQVEEMKQRVQVRVGFVWSLWGILIQHLLPSWR